jgi:hypothetical protein
MLAIVALLSLATLAAPVALLAQIADPGALPLPELPASAPAWVAVVAMFFSQLTQTVLAHLRQRDRARGAELKLDAIHAAVTKVDAIHAALIEEGSDGSRVPRLRTQHEEFLRVVAESSQRHAAAVESMSRLQAAMNERVDHLEDALVAHHRVAEQIARNLAPAASAGSLEDTGSLPLPPRRRRSDR